MLETGHYEKLDEFLRDCIRAIRGKMNLKSRDVARRLNIPNASFNRIENKEVKRASFAHAVKIVRAACAQDNFMAFVEKFYPEMLKTIKQTYPGNADVPFIACEAERFFSDRSSYEIMMMATTPNGVTKEKVQTLYGLKGLEILEDLINEQVVEFNDGRAFLNQNIKFGQETTQQLLQNLVSFSYSLNTFGTGENWLSVQYEAVNRNNVAPKVRDIMIQANAEIRAVMNAPENNGDDVFWAGLVFDHFGKKERSTDSTGVIQ